MRHWQTINLSSKTPAIKAAKAQSKNSCDEIFHLQSELVSILYITEEAEPLRQRRKWRDPRCDAYTVSEANDPTKMGASCAANVIANFNATPSAALAANHSAAVVPTLR